MHSFFLKFYLLYILLFLHCKDTYYFLLRNEK
nr:MAG TPA: hypothetical protein [Caudoviricetes sp.]